MSPARAATSGFAISPAGIVSLFGLLLAPVAVLNPNAVVPLLVIAAVLAGLAAWRDSRHVPWPPVALTVLFGVLLLWAAAASFWSFDVQRALILALRLGGLVLAGLALYAVVRSRTADERRQIARWLSIGYGLGILAFLVEYLLDFPIIRLAKQLDPSETIPLSRLNRGAAALAMLIWPVAAATLPGLRARWRLVLPLCIVPIVALSESAAALAGLLLGCAFVVLLELRRTPARQLLIVVVVLGFVMGPVIAHQLYDRGLHESDHLAHNAQARVYIWNFVADRIAEKPVLGWGLDASRHIPNFGTPTFGGEAGKVVPLHPHNAVLQLWLELGAIGAGLGLLIVAYVWRRIGPLPRVQGLAAHGLLVTTLVIACTAYGTWQSKWVSVVFAVAALLPLARDDQP